MSFQLVPKSVTLNDLERVMAVTLRYFTEFDKPVYQNNRVDLCMAEFMHESIVFCSACTICRRKESSRSLSHLLMSFLLLISECRRRFSKERFARASPSSQSVIICNWHVAHLPTRNSSGETSHTHSPSRPLAYRFTEHLNGYRVPKREWHFKSWKTFTFSGFPTAFDWFFRVFSERELIFTFAICHRPSVCRLSVCNVRAPYSGDWNFRQYFYAIWYVGHADIQIKFYGHRPRRTPPSR